MKYFSYVFAVLALSAGIHSGCSLTGAEKDDKEMIPVDFSSVWVNQGSAPDITAKGADGQIMIQGALGTADPCYDIEGQAEREETEITLRITAISKQVICIAVFATFEYDAILKELPAGKYFLLIEHSYAGAGASDEVYTALEQEILVK